MKIAAITGSTSGIGKETASSLVDKGYHVIHLVRDTTKGNKVAAAIQNDGPTEVIHCDLAKLASVKAAGENLLNNHDHLDLLINNAGGYFHDRYITDDDLEMSFQVNHLSHFLLTEMLIPLLKKSDNPRVVNVSSEAHKAGKPNWEDLQMQNNYSSWRQYGNVKLFNIWHARELSRRYGHEGIMANAVHPGGVNTKFDRDMRGSVKLAWTLMKPFLRSPAKGAETTIHVATSDQLKNVSGKYFKDKKEASPSKLARDDEGPKHLWEISENMINNKLQETPIGK